MDKNITWHRQGLKSEEDGLRVIRLLDDRARCIPVHWVTSRLRDIPVIKDEGQGVNFQLGHSPRVE